MLAYLRLEILRTLRDRRFLFFTVAFPVALFLLFSSIYGDDGTEPGTGLDVAQYMMVAFGSYGAIGAALNATGPRLAMELHGGWLRQLRVTPLAAWKVITVRILTALVVSLPALVLVTATAVLVQDVQLAAGRWVELLAVLTLATLPFAALGVMIGSFLKPDAAQPAMLMLYLPMAVVGGLWVTVDQLPGFLKEISPWTPANRMAELGWDLVGGHAPSVTAVAVLAAWTAGFGALALLGYRRAAAA